MMNTILFRASGNWSAVPASGESLEMNVLFNFAVGNGGAFLVFALTETTLSRALQTLATSRAKWLMTINLVTVGLLTGKSVTIVAAGAPAAKRCLRMLLQRKWAERRDRRGMKGKSEPEVQATGGAFVARDALYGMARLREIWLRLTFDERESMNRKAAEGYAGRFSRSSVLKRFISALRALNVREGSSSEKSS